MTKRIFRAICLVALAVFLACFALTMTVLYTYFSSVQQQQLTAQTALAVQGVAHEGSAYLEDLDVRGYRLTWIADDGTVLYDNEADPAHMENHAGREEVQSALTTGFGESSRYSSTLTERRLYTAQLLPDGTVIRLSCSQRSVLALLYDMLWPLLVVVVLAVALSLLLASRISKRIVQPLNALDLDEPLANEGYDELSPLLRRLESQRRQIAAQMAELRQKQEEFSAATGSMNEGLVLLNAQGKILSINAAAARLLETGDQCLGQDMLTVCRSLPMQELLQKAQRGERAEQVMPLGEGRYQLDAGPVYAGDTVSGVVLLMFDVTEKANAEQLRREFTANVSHELRTPLHSISGCAELLHNDMVKPADVKQFTGQIYDEAQRMIRLVDDIIRLSRLDEGATGLKREPVDLYALAQTALQSLEPLAAEQSVSCHLSGGSATVCGVPQLLHGIIYNLCDNAIKYNRPGGRVEVTVTPADGETVLTVADTGIGIPPEHQSRVYERFYRVDKSHSKQTGGTGLGLSIVKHAAALHDAKLELQSAVGQGTTITLHFPQASTDD